MNNLESIRLNRELTYRDMASMVGRVPSLVYRDCRTDNLSADVAMEYARAFGLTVTDIDPELAERMRAYLGGADKVSAAGNQ